MNESVELGSYCTAFLLGAGVMMIYGPTYFGNGIPPDVEYNDGMVVFDAELSLIAGAIAAYTTHRVCKYLGWLNSK